MRLSLRFFSGEEKALDVDPQSSVKSLREEAKKALPTQGAKPELSSVTLIYGGKMMADDRTLESYNVKEGDKVICMVKQVSKKPAASKSTPVIAPASTPAAVPAAVPAAAAPPASPSTISQPVASSMAGSVLTGEALQDAVANLVALSGKTPEEVEAAMAAAFNDPDRAYEYLENGLPTRPSPVAARLPPTDEAETMSGPGASEFPAMPQPGAGDNRNEQLGILLRELQNVSPEERAAFLGALSQRNPEIFGNPEAIEMVQRAVTAWEGGDAAGEGDMPQAPPAIQISEEDNAAIERLVTLGFEKIDAAQAYFAFDKNEEAAADYLFRTLEEN
eukprot:GHVP01009788.1.p2 GENE.GHVP01009788.1~~GHVP01009788.1.p2  ORF type:complete len:342 (-),score=96.43 GHVP01009788.1:3911-4909(-)